MEQQFEVITTYSRRGMESEIQEYAVRELKAEIDH